MREQKDWNLARTDSEFSKYVRARDGRCKNPLCPDRVNEIKALECSHFWPRALLISRFDPDNCIALCHSCHVAWENTKQGRYKEVMIMIIGQARFDALERRVEIYKYKNIPEISMNTAIKACREFLQYGKKIIFG